MKAKLLGASLFVVATIVIVGALPLCLGLVEPNRVYGVRFSGSFTSGANWHRINRYGGAALMVWGFSALLVSLVVMVPSRVPQRLRLWLGLLYPMSVVVPVLFTYLYALRP